MRAGAVTSGRPENSDSENEHRQAKPCHAASVAFAAAGRNPVNRNMISG
jgi:hypothetical protein